VHNLCRRKKLLNEEKTKKEKKKMRHVGSAHVGTAVTLFDRAPGGRLLDSSPDGKARQANPLDLAVGYHVMTGVDGSKVR
jgi:hypothetical protein